jgi:hypothetical protein
MRRALATLFFVLGCLLTGFAIAWWIAAECGVLSAPKTPLEGVVAFIPYAVLMLVTVDRASARNWLPVLKVTRARILLARLLLSLTVANFLIAIAVAVAGQKLGSTSLPEHAFYWVIGSLLLLNGVYFALHWAYRPHNLFGPHVPEALLDPFGITIHAILKAIGLVKRPERDGSKRKRDS